MSDPTVHRSAAMQPCDLRRVERRTVRRGRSAAGCSTSCRDAGAAPRRSRSVHPPTLAATAEAVARRRWPPRASTPTARDPGRRGRQGPGRRRRSAGRCSAGSGSTRSDAVVALGGGAATDLAGFVAATWMRGVRGRPRADDAARHGRRRGRRQDRHQHRGGQEPGRRVPRAGRRARRPRRPWTRCRARARRRHGRGDQGRVHRRPGDPRARSRPTPRRRSTPPATCSRELVERSIQVKADVVAADLRESDLREILNYGHTLGHAIERRERYRWRHGAAVSVGLVFAAELARLAGRLDDATADRHRTVLTSRRPADHLRRRRACAELVDDHARGQEDPRRHAAVRRARRAGEARPPRGPGPGAAGRGLLRGRAPKPPARGAVLL